MLNSFYYDFGARLISLTPTFIIEPILSYIYDPPAFFCPRRLRSVCAEESVQISGAPFQFPVRILDGFTGIDNREAFFLLPQNLPAGIIKG